jgi:hypothetical protein
MRAESAAAAQAAARGRQPIDIAEKANMKRQEKQMHQQSGK